MKKRLTAFLLILIMVLSSCGKGGTVESTIVTIPDSAAQAKEFATPDKPKIGMAWRYNKDGSPSVNENVRNAIIWTGAEAVQLGEVKFLGFSYDENGNLLPEYVNKYGALKKKYADMLKKSPLNSDAKEVVGDIRFVIFTGGCDISPSLFLPPETVDNEFCKFDATRDVSEYLTMCYCLENDIGILGICRGMQLLGVVSGMSYIQDFGTFFERQNVIYDNTHSVGGAEKSEYALHGVEIIKKSKAYEIFGEEHIDSVMSLHHQSPYEYTGDNLIISGFCETCGIKIPEIIERTDKSFAVGIQFHPEVALARRNNPEISAEMITQSERFFNYIAEKAR